MRGVVVVGGGTAVSGAGEGGVSGRRRGGAEGPERSVGDGSAREGERRGGDVSRGRHVGDVEDVQELLQLFASDHLVDVRPGQVRVGLWDERVRPASLEEGGHHASVPLLAEAGGDGEGGAWREEAYVGGRGREVV